MARGIEDIYFMVVIVESHHRGCNGDSTLFFYFHPVGGRRLLDLVGLNSSCHMDRATEKQQLFSKSCFSCVRVRNDGESAPAVDFINKGCHVYIIL